MSLRLYGISGCDDMKGKYSIQIKDLRLFGYHGVREKEKKEGQYFIFNIDISIDSSTVKSDDLSETINYSEIIRTIKHINNSQRFDLLETFSNVIASKIMKAYPQVEKVSVNISKPKPPIDEKLSGVGVGFFTESEKKAADMIIVQRPKVYLCLGSNIGDREANLRNAVSMLNKSSFLEIIQISSIYETEPMHVKEQGPFYNIVLSLELTNTIDPFVLMGYLKSVEYSLGRKKDKIRFGPRIIDIDILYFQDIKIESDFLTIPHKSITQRRFVLVPLSEISPYFEIAGVNIRKLIDSMEGKEEVRFLKNW